MDRLSKSLVLVSVSFRRPSPPFAKSKTAIGASVVIATKSTQSFPFGHRILHGNESVNKNRMVLRQLVCLELKTQQRSFSPLLPLCNLFLQFLIRRIFGMGIQRKVISSCIPSIQNENLMESVEISAYFIELNAYSLPFFKTVRSKMTNENIFVAKNRFLIIFFAFGFLF